jgi:hypothetical protein
VIAAQQFRDADQGLVGEYVGGERRDRRPAVDVGERLGHRPGPEDAGRAVEAGGGEVAKERVGGGPTGGGRPHHGVADPDDTPPVGCAAGERHVSQGGCRRGEQARASGGRVLRA